MSGRPPEYLDSTLELISISQKPITPDSLEDLDQLRGLRLVIEALRPGALLGLNRDTTGVMLFDLMHTSEDQHAVFLPSPQMFRRNDWEFETRSDGALCKAYLGYFILLRKVLRERPGDWLRVGVEGSVNISDHSQLAITSVSASDYFYLEVRKQGPDIKLFVDTPEELVNAIKVAPPGLGIEIRQKDTSELWTNIARPCNQCPLQAMKPLKI